MEMAGTSLDKPGDDGVGESIISVLGISIMQIRADY
jgi:hypothetical protein